MTTKKCKKCGNLIPKGGIVDGKYRSFGTRKFCVGCSPHAARSLRYAMQSPERKAQICLAVSQLGHRRKLQLIKMAGGKCIECGYDKCFRSLSFHHRDPSLKSFPCSGNGLIRKWSLVLKEVEKCDLLCLNCHAEKEESISVSRQGCYRHQAGSIPAAPTNLV